MAWRGVWDVKREERFGVLWRRGFRASGVAMAVEVRSRVEREGKGVGLLREVMGLERRLSVRR